MNIVNCGEKCRWQKDGLCTLEDLTRGGEGNSGCRYFESPAKEDCQ